MNNEQLPPDITTKTVVSLNKPTPQWATWVFRIIFLLTGVAVFIVSGDNAINPTIVVRILVYLKGLDMAIWGITRMLGVDISRDYNYKNGNL